MNFFNMLFDSISAIGLFPKKLISLMVKKLSKALKRLWAFVKEGFSSAGTFFKRAVVITLIAAVLFGVIYVGAANSNRVDAICVKIDNKIIGYTNSQTEADVAKAYALKVLGTKSFERIKFAMSPRTKAMP